MSVHGAIWDEWHSSRLNYHDVKRIRVTPHAIQGSPATVPFAPDCVVLRGHPPYETHRWREILVHPDDWSELLADFEHSSDLSFGVRLDPVCTTATWTELGSIEDSPVRQVEFLFGIEVVR